MTEAQRNVVFEDTLKVGKYTYNWTVTYRTHTLSDGSPVTIYRVEWAYHSRSGHGVMGHLETSVRATAIRKVAEMQENILLWAETWGPKR